MGEYSAIIENLVYFVLFVMAILFVGAIGLKLYLKNFKFSTSKSRVYGMLTQLDNRSILAFCLATLNYLFLVWCAMTIPDINIIYISLIIVMTLLCSIMAKDYIKIPINLLVAGINCFALYIVQFVHSYLLGEVSDILMRISIFFIIAFVYIYFTYNFINDINDIVQKNKHIQKKIDKRKAGVEN